MRVMAVDEKANGKGDFMLRRSLFALFCLCVGLLVGWATQDVGWPLAGRAQNPNTVPLQSNFPVVNVRPNSPPVVLPDLGEYSPEEQINIAVYDKCNRGVVNISTRSLRMDSFLFASSVEGSGSGSVIDKSGHVLTNFHVIEDARDINVTLFNGESYPAILVGQDQDNDIAVLRIEAPEDRLFPIEIGDSSNLRVGQRIIAIGNPFGLERTMTDGIISSLNRQLPSRNRRTMKSIVQIDAALNQGNSGGPLLNTRGDLIGMNTAIATSTGDSAGIGFAIPSRTIRRVVPQLILNGYVVRPTIGIMRVEEKENGLMVVELTPKGPAEKAGVKGYKVIMRKFRRNNAVFQQPSIDPSEADLIVGCDGIKISTADDLLTIIENKKPGDVVNLSVSRQGQIVNIPVTLGGAE
jgi:S1-C subfamily serine protease